MRYSCNRAVYGRPEPEKAGDEPLEPLDAKEDSEAQGL